jgi:histidine triad (HIT) family protein
MKEYKDDCIFCKIAMNQLNSNKVYEDVNTCAFLDINPRNPGHTLVVPKKHYETIFELPDKMVAELFRAVKRVSVGIKKGMKADGITIAQSNESAAGQVINHIHVHVIPRFAPEDPVSIEGMLPMKVIKKGELSKIVSSIKRNTPK